MTGQTPQQCRQLVAEVEADRAAEARARQQRLQARLAKALASMPYAASSPQQQLIKVLNETQQRFTPVQSSLIKLAHASLRLHCAGVAADMCPRTPDGHSKPLAAAVAALGTVAKQRELEKE